MGWFGELPEDCISKIISRTSPRDACRASSISWGFKSAVDSDGVWEQFLPSDCLEILSEMAVPVVFSTKKELYFHLSDSHVLLDGGKMSLSVGKESGKKCYMVGARQLAIALGDDPRSWARTSSPHSRFLEVAELLNVTYLEIRGKLQTKLLSQKTTYVVYFVFKFASETYGRELANTSIRYLNKRKNITYKEANTVAPQIQICGSGFRRLQSRRKDGWMEYEAGAFFNDCGDDGDVEMWFTSNQFRKPGLIVEGIEFRPKDDVK
ncbi:hypothetical protein LguiB_026012 [Lonicera macranthoides]